MKRLFLILMSVAFVTMAQAQSNYVEVVGESRIEVAPNSITLEVVVIGAKVESEMIAALKSAGIDTKNALKLSDLQGQLRRRSDQTISLRYELTLSSVEQLTAVVSALEGVSGSSTRMLKCENTDIEKFQDEARRLAIEDAQRKAQQISKVLDQQVGYCIQLTDGGSMYAPAGVLMRANDAMLQGVELRNIEIPYRVTARFVLASARIK